MISVSLRPSPSRRGPFLQPGSVVGQHSPTEVPTPRGKNRQQRQGYGLLDRYWSLNETEFRGVKDVNIVSWWPQISRMSSLCVCLACDGQLHRIDSGNGHT